MTEIEMDNRWKKSMDTAKKAIAIFLKSLRGASRSNEDSSSLIAARAKIRLENDATSINEFSCKNAKIEHDNHFEECTVEDDDSSANDCVAEEENESVRMMHLKSIKDEIKEATLERKKGLKKI